MSPKQIEWHFVDDATGQTIVVITGTTWPHDDGPQDWELSNVRQETEHDPLKLKIILEGHYLSNKDTTDSRDTHE
jgi:hypothetical protein|tara:strand:- start:309 stop:533 length:225 start_codon:yes stop_codon:yes gene_type:complete